MGDLSFEDIWLALILNGFDNIGSFGEMDKLTWEWKVNKI